MRSSTRSDTVKPDRHASPSVRVDNLSIAYGAHEALHNVALEVEKGSFVAVLGPNGSGKTSLIKALVGIVPPARGRVLIFGLPPHLAGTGLIGYVPQVKTLERQFPATALELIVSGLRGRWPARISGEEKDDAIEALQGVGGAHLYARQLSALSGGELQRIYLARSLIRRPRLVLLDEPATGIDAAGASDLYDVLESYQRRHDATIIMVTHDWNAAFHHATHVLLLNREQISYGQSEDVLSEQNLRRAFGHVGHEHAMLRSGSAEQGHE